MEKVETVISPQEEAIPQPESFDRVARCIECSNEWIAGNGNEPKPSRCPVCMSRDVKWRDECTGDEVSKKDLKSTLKKKTVKKAEAEPEPEKKAAPATKKPAPKKPTPKRGANGAFVKKSALLKAEEPKSETPLYDKVFSQRESQKEPPEEEPPEGVKMTPGYITKPKEFTYADAVAAAPKVPMQSIVFIFAALAAVFGIFFLIRKGKGLSSPRRKEAPAEEVQPVSFPTNYFGGSLL